MDELELRDFYEEKLTSFDPKPGEELPSAIRWLVDRATFRTPATTGWPEYSFSGDCPKRMANDISGWLDENQDSDRIDVAELGPEFKATVQTEFGVINIGATIRGRRKRGKVRINMWIYPWEVVEKDPNLDEERAEVDKDERVRAF